MLGGVCSILVNREQGRAKLMVKVMSGPTLAGSTILRRLAKYPAISPMKIGARAFASGPSKLYLVPRLPHTFANQAGGLACFFRLSRKPADTEVPPSFARVLHSRGKLPLNFFDVLGRRLLGIVGVQQCMQQTKLGE